MPSLSRSCGKGLARKLAPLFAKQGNTPLHDLRVEKRSSLPFKLNEHDLQLQCGPIRTCGRHCIENIGNSQNPCHGQDIVPFQSSWVTRSVHALMVLPNDFGNRPGERNVFQNGVTSLGM